MLSDWISQVENVARFLFFMDPVEPSLEFVWQPERVWEYVNELKEAKQSRQTIQNYLKSIRRSGTFIIHVTSI